MLFEIWFLPQTTFNMFLPHNFLAIEYYFNVNYIRTVAANVWLWLHDANMWLQQLAIVLALLLY